MVLLDQVHVSIPCLACGAKTFQTWRWLKDRPVSFTCWQCQDLVDLDYSGTGVLGSIMRAVDAAGLR